MEQRPGSAGPFGPGGTPMRPGAPGGRQTRPDAPHGPARPSASPVPRARERAQHGAGGAARGSGTDVRRRGKAPKAPTGCAFFLCVGIVILALAWVITWVLETPARRAAAASSAAAASEQAARQAQSKAQKAGQEAAGAGVGPVRQEDAGGVQPITAALVALPENGRVDMRYFSDALFIGDSLTQGFEVYASGIPNAKYAAYVGVGPKQLMEGTVPNIRGENVAAIDEILAAAPKKVYILLGTNSMANLTDDAFLKYYEDFLNYLQPKLPSDTIYYIQGIPPVTAEKSAADAHYPQSRIIGLNDRLARLAYGRGLHYLDLYTPLADGSGALRPAYATGSDGIHLNGAGYDAWREYLITHTVYSKDNPYLPGSPLYVAPAS